MFKDTDGKTCSYRVTSLRTPNIFLNTLEKGKSSLTKYIYENTSYILKDALPYVLLPSPHRNQKLDEKI